MQGYKKIDQFLHQLSQVIAKVNKAYVPHEADDSHTNLYFDSVSSRITGRWFNGNTGRYLLVFDLKKWEYQILDESLKIIEQVSQDGKTFHQSETELIDALKELNFAVGGLTQPLHFEIPTYAFLEENLDRPKENSLISWIQIRTQANHACMEFLGHIQKSAEIRIWPHHFDTGVYVEVNQEVGVGFGLAMADSIIDTPYFYLSGYPLKEKSWDWTTPSELKSGKWMVSDNWKGAMLPFADENIKDQAIREFIKGSLSWYLT